MFQEMLAMSAGDSNVLKFKYCPNRPAEYQDYIAIETSSISHFKGAIDTALSTYSDDVAYKVGYANTLPVAGTTFWTTLTDEVRINGADFDVSTSYTYLIITALAGAYGRTYDIELTLR